MLSEKRWKNSGDVAYLLNENNFHQSGHLTMISPFERDMVSMDGWLFGLFILLFIFHFKFVHPISSPNRTIGLISKVFALGPGDRGSIPVESTKKW